MLWTQVLRASCGGDGRGLGTELLGAGGTRALLTPQRRPFPSLGCLSPTEISTVDSYRQWEPIHLFLWFTDAICCATAILCQNRGSLQAVIRLFAPLFNTYGFQKRCILLSLVFPNEHLFG